MSQTNPMVPDRNWGEAARQFAQETGGQALVCAWCEDAFDRPAPPRIVILHGNSVCRDHIQLAMDASLGKQ